MSCAKKGEAGIQQIAVLRFENFSPDAEADWVGRGLAESVAAAIAPGASVQAQDSVSLHRFDAALGRRISAAPGISTELPNARLAFATRVICGYYTVLAGGRVEVSAVELDTATRQTRRVASATGGVRQLPQLSEQLARGLGYSTRPPLTLNDTALRSYADGLEASTAEAARDKYQEAAAADPSFGAAYVAWARAGIALHDRGVFERALDQASRHARQIAPYYRSTLAALRAEAQGDTQARAAALEALARDTPADPVILRFLGDAELSAGQYPQAIIHYEQAARATPQDPDPRNLLTYAYLAQDNESAALRQAAEYARLAPESANPVDSRGDVQFHFNHYADALKSYLEAFRRDPEMDSGGSLEKAAVCELLLGDLSKANELHQRYVQDRASRRDPAAELRQADWYFLTGKRAEAIESARNFAARAAAIPPLRAAALTRVAAWQKESPVEAYSLLFGRDWDRALPVWKTLAGNPNQQSARAIYAWLLLQRGRKSEAAKYAATTPLWHPNDISAGVWFPRLLAVRAATGPAAEQAARVYQSIGGDAATR